MQSHGPKRIYSPQSLEWWFEKLENDWAPHFSEEVLELGRAIYRDGGIREVELGRNDAIIHRKVDKKEEYAVIEWEADKPMVRSSSTDPKLAGAIAVAGLHEIEELLAEEISPLPIDAKGAPPRQPAAKESLVKTNGHGAAAQPAPVVAGPASAAAAAAADANGKAKGESARPFILHFRPAAGGLVCEAFWEEPNGSRVPVYGPGGSALTQLGSGERSKVIGLATYARKAHFRFQQETHAYVLDSVREIPEFLKTALPVWKKHFQCEVDPALKQVQTGVRTIEVEAHATKKDANGLNLRWIFRAGERLLTDAEVKAVSTRHGQPVMLPDIGIVSLPTDKWESVLNWRRTVEDLHGGALPPFLLFSLFNDARWNVTLSADVEMWKSKVLSPGAQPAGIPDFLREYQRRGVEWMHHLCETGCHGLLADEMGLGKTLQVLTLLATRPKAKLRHLIVCPASVVPVWREEAARFYPHLKVETLKTGHDFVTNPEPVIWLASYTQLRKHREQLEKKEFGYVILDEGQFIKNPDAKVTNACFTIRAAHRIVLTGTPLENRQLDLWSIFRFLLPGLLGSRAAFENALLSNRDGTIERLRAQIAPFVLRRTKAEVAKELPPKVVMDLLCPLTDVQRVEYAKICEEGLKRLGSDLGAAMRERSFGFFALLTRLRQTCCDPDLLPWVRAGLSDSGKVNLLVQKLAEVLAGGHKIVIFSQFVMFLNRVRDALEAQFPDVPRYELTGVTLDRQKPVKDFQSAEGRAIMLVSLKAAGTGITLHAADYVFLLDPWWNPAVEDQAVDRVHRLGQTNTVFVYRLITAGTIEERIQALKAEKKAMFDRIVGNFRTEFDLSQHFTSLESLIKLAAAPEAESDPAESNGAV